MKVAFAHWDNRIAPVFDTVHQICVVEVESGQIVRESEEPLTNDLPVQKALRLVELGVGALVCGAISRSLHEVVAAYGIQVVPFVAGDLRQVIQAWISGGFVWKAFAMPGCCRNVPFKGIHDADEQEKNTMMKGRGGGGGGGRRGQGRGERRAGFMGSSLAAGPPEFCICPQCGRKEPHVRGTSCVDRKCPKCGVEMTRSRQ